MDYVYQKHGGYEAVFAKYYKGVAEKYIVGLERDADCVVEIAADHHVTHSVSTTVYRLSNSRWCFESG